jgi:malonyl-CoA O-methyltransferase
MQPSEPRDEFDLDSRNVRAAFDRASARYEAAAVLQTRVRGELLERLSLMKLEPQVVLDLGSGPGQGSYELKRSYRRALVIALDLAPGMLREARRQMGLLTRFERVCADAPRLPLANGSVDLVFSNLMLQWCNDLDAVLAEVRRVLKPSGFFTFSTFGPDTLKELRAAWSAADGYSHVNRFLDMHDVGDALARSGLMEPVLDVDRVQLTYPDALALMRDLKAIGAHNVTSGRARGLTGKARLRKMTDAYESFRREGRLPATYEVVYGVAWGAIGKPASPVIEGEARVPLSAIRRPGTRS